MALIDILVPQMGEGLTEVRILSFQKKPGDRVERDEPLYSMETDKANMDVESPYAGVLQEWLAKEDEVLPVGAPVARMEVEMEATAEETAPVAAAPTAAATGETAKVIIPPRTRAHARYLGLSEEELKSIPAPGGKLMPEHVDAYVAAKAGQDGKAASGTAQDYEERDLSPQQRTFVYRLKRSVNVAIPGTIKRPVVWDSIKRQVEAAKAGGASVKPSEFQTIAWCVAQTVKDYPKFRSVLIGDEKVREYAHVNLGIAVARQNGDLVTAVVQNADTLEYPDFLRMAQARILAGRRGEDQADANTQILLTYLGPYGVIDAVPVLVAPAMAVLFIGSTYEQNGQLLANLVLTFDHRLINGVDAAEFLRALVEKAESVDQTI